MASIEFSIANQKYLLKSDDDDAHLNEVAELVRRKVEGIRKKNATLSLHKAIMLAAIDFASQVIKGRKRALNYQSDIIVRANRLLQKVESKLESSPSGITLS